MKKLFFILLFVPFFLISQKGCEVFGKIEFVESGENYKVKILDKGSDLKIRLVSFEANSKGKWELVNSGANYKLKIVDFGEDFSVEEVDFGEGCGEMELDHQKWDKREEVYTKSNPLLQAIQQKKMIEGRSGIKSIDADFNNPQKENELGRSNENLHNEARRKDGALSMILLIKKIEKVYYTHLKEYEKNPTIKTAFEIEENTSEAIDLSKKIFKILKSNFNEGTKIENKWGPINEEHKAVIKKYGKYKKYKRKNKL